MNQIWIIKEHIYYIEIVETKKNVSRGKGAVLKM